MNNFLFLIALTWIGMWGYIASQTEWFFLLPGVFGYVIIYILHFHPWVIKKYVLQDGN